MKYIFSLGLVILVLFVGCTEDYDAADSHPQYVYEIKEVIGNKRQSGRVGTYYRKLAAESYAMEFGRLLAIRDYQERYGNLP